MFSVEHSSSTGPAAAVMEEGGGRGKRLPVQYSS